MNRNNLYLALVLVTCIVGTVILRTILLGGVPLVNLQPAAPLSGVLAQSIPTKGGGLAKVDKDYYIKSSRYFDNNTWAVASIVFAGQGDNTASVVLHKKAGFYTVVLGPGTSFARADTKSFPDDVITYLESLGVGIYGAD
jgi:hypothetical protein